MNETIELYDTHDKCVICIELILNENLNKICNCTNSLVCNTCLILLENNKTTTCPLCRKSLNYKITYNYIYNYTLLVKKYFIPTYNFIISLYNFVLLNKTIQKFKNDDFINDDIDYNIIFIFFCISNTIIYPLNILLCNIINYKTITFKTSIHTVRYNCIYLIYQSIFTILGNVLKSSKLLYDIYYKYLIYCNIIIVLIPFIIVYLALIISIFLNSIYYINAQLKSKLTIMVVKNNNIITSSLV